MKAKEFYYECIHPEGIEMNYLAPDHRKERWEGLTPPIVPHPIRFYPFDAMTGKSADYVVTDRPLAQHLLTPIIKSVQRKNLRTSKKSMVETVTKPKFRLLEPEEVTESIKKVAWGKAEFTKMAYAEEEKKAEEPVAAAKDSKE